MIPVNQLPTQDNQQRRRSIRLHGYDYRQAGAYFVTICTHDRMCLFGQVVGGEMRLNARGRIVEQCWLEIPRHFPHVALDVFVVMPNHVHSIIILNDVGTRPVGARHAVPLQRERFGKPVTGSIPTIIRSFKSAATKQINIVRRLPDAPVWQRNYYEHVIRNDEPLNHIREYIITNPLRWALDPENPVGTKSQCVPAKPWEV